MNLKHFIAVLIALSLCFSVMVVFSAEEQNKDAGKAKEEELNKFSHLFSIPELASVKETEQGAVVGEIGDEKIYDGQLEETLKGQLYESYMQIYTHKSNLLDLYMNSKLIKKEAQERGVSVRDLFAQEVLAKVTEPSDEELNAIWEEKKGNSPKKFEEVKKQVYEYVKQQRVEATLDVWLNQLRTKIPIKVALVEPKEPLFEVDVTGKILRGNPNAPITIAEFSDFQCPYCQRATETIHEVLKAYPDQVKLAFFDYPLPFHKRAVPAAEAARCAGEQNKYWEFHDLLFEKKGFEDKDLEGYAKDLNLNADAFKSCFDAHKFQAEIEKDKQTGNRVGVTGTPAFFINGKKLTGAQPFAEFDAVIKKALEGKEKGTAEAK